MAPKKKPVAGVAPGSTRYRFTVPDADVDVVSWIHAQENLSISLRYIIKKIIQQDGIVDAFCGPISGPMPRPAQPAEAPVAQVSPAPSPVPEAKPKAQAPVVPVPPVQAVPKPAQQPVQQPAGPVEVDGDGFVDPDKFFQHLGG